MGGCEKSGEEYASCEHGESELDESGHDGKESERGDGGDSDDRDGGCGMEERDD